MTKTSLILVLGLVLSLSLLSAMEHTVGLRLGASYPFTDVTEDENNLNFMGGLSGFWNHANVHGCGCLGGLADVRWRAGRFHGGGCGSGWRDYLQ